MSDLVRNSEDGFSHDASQFVLLISQIPVTEKKSNLSINFYFLCDFKMYKSSIMLRLHYEIQSADRIFLFLSADKHHFVR